MATGATAAGAPDRVCASPSPEGDSPVGRQRAGSAMACAPCVARPSPLPERVAAIASAIGAEVEPLVTLTHLLQLCRDEHAVLWERVNDPDAPGDRLAEILADVRSVLHASSSVAVLNPEVRCALASALGAARAVPAVLVVNALAELIDERYGHSFAESFSRRSPYRPGVGDPIPLDSPDLRQVTVLSGTSPPWRLANRLDETRDVRLAGEWASQFRVIFDNSLAEPLGGIVGPDTIVATCREVGLDPASMTVLGVLPAVALPDSGFLLTPVLAWSPRPTLTSSANLAEVTSLAMVPLAHLTQPEPRWPGVLGGDAAPEGAPVAELLGDLGAVTRVLIDLVTGMLTRTDLDEQGLSHPRAATRRRTATGKDQS